MYQHRPIQNRGRSYYPEIDNRTSILTALRDSEKYQSQLTSIIGETEHLYLNTRVTILRNHIRSTNYQFHDRTKEKLNRIEAIQLAKIALENILHVADDISYIKGYYKKFLCDSAVHKVGKEKTESVTEFDARIGYSFALIDLVIGYISPKNRGVDDKFIVEKAKIAKQQLLTARKHLSGKKVSEIPDTNAYLLGSYQAVNDLRDLLAEKFHKLDGRMRKK